MEIPPRSTYTKTTFPLLQSPRSTSLVANALLGLWTFRIGRFGCPDRETRGGVIHFVENGQLLGGDSDYSFCGEWTLQDSELRSRIRIVSHSHSIGSQGVFGAVREPFDLLFNAEAINRDYFEGYSRRTGYPEFRVIMHRARQL